MSETPRHAIFLSHSGADAEAARRLRKLIESSPDAREAGLKIWFDKNDLVPGSYWQTQIEDNIEKIATGFLVYIGSKGIADWVEAEVRLALSRAGQDKDFQFVPILAKDSPDLAALPGFAKLYQAVRDPLNDPVELQKLVATLLRTSDAARVKVIAEPFVGLRSMDEEDAHLFFGRADELNELVGKLKKHRLVAIVADSGTGKSSLAKAGLIPAFRDGALAESGGQEPRDRIWHVVVMRPGRDPQSGLRSAATVAAQKMGLSEDAQEGLRKRVTDGDVEEKAFALRCDCPPDRTETLLVVDQFEELLTQTPAEKRASFVGLLMELAFGAGDYGFRVLLTVRADYFNLCREFRALYDRLMENGQESMLRLKRISDKGIEEAVMAPLRLAGQKDEDTHRALVAEITRDVSDRPGDMALIQMALYAAWEERARNGGDMLQAYAAVGGVAGALAHEADKVRKDVLDDGERKLLEPILVRLVRLGETAGATRRVARRSEFDESQLALVEKLTNEKDGRRLLVAGSDTIEIGHEALITQWPWLQGLVEKVGLDLRAFERLMDKAARWKRAGPDKGAEYLATGAEREEFLALAGRQDTWISATERDFISASSAAFAADEWRKRVLLVSLGAAVIVLMMAFGVAVFYYRNSAIEAREAVANLSAAETAMAESESARHPVEAAKLALAAWPIDGKDIAPKLDATLDLLGRVVPQLRERIRIRSGGTTASFSPDGTRILTTSDDGTARIWDAADGRATATLRGHDQGLTFAAFSPDGKTVVTTSKDKTARVWDVASQREIARLAGHRDVVASAAFSPDGGRVVTASEDGAARVWNALTGVPIATLEGHSDAVTSAAFSPDGRRVVTASADKTARIWDAADGRQIGPALTHDGAVNSAAFSPDGGRVVTASDDGAAQIWNALTGLSIATLRRGADSVTSLAADELGVLTAAFSPDGSRIVTASADKTARIWNASDGSQIGSPLMHDGLVTSAAFSNDNKWVLTSSADGAARIGTPPTGWRSQD